MANGENPLDEFVAYAQKVSIDRIRPGQVPSHLRPLFDCYMQALLAQLADPENESTSSLGPNERHNAMQVAKQKFAPALLPKPKGNCPRCAGTGFISAYRHIHGGKCLQCDGSSWISVEAENKIKQ